MEQMLLSPPGKTTRIDRKHYRVIDSYLSVGDRIAWHRPYGIIHTAIVVGVNEADKKLCVFERAKNENGIEVAPNWISLDDEIGQLYRCDEDLENIPFSKMLRIMLNKLGEKGYHLLFKNCQTLVQECKREDKESFQTQWFGVNSVVQAVKSFGRPITAELIELFFGGAEKIGIITIFGLQTVFFLMEFYAAYQRLKEGDITWKTFTELVIRQFSMAIFSSIGTALGGSLVALLTPKAILMVLMTVTGAFISMVLLDWAESDNCFVRYLGWMAGGIAGLVCSCFSPSWVFEILLACLLGFGGLAVGHVFGYVASWLGTGSGADCRIVKDLKELKRGDHISKYEWFLHPNCHAIFVEEMANGKMKIIRNTYQRGEIEEVVSFNPGEVYRYHYHQSECCDEHETVQRAYGAVRRNENNYSWFTYNCETFAKECKCKGNDDTDSVPRRPEKKVDWDRHFAEMISEPGLPEEKIRSLEVQFQSLAGRIGCFP